MCLIRQWIKSPIALGNLIPFIYVFFSFLHGMKLLFISWTDQCLKPWPTPRPHEPTRFLNHASNHDRTHVPTYEPNQDPTHELNPKRIREPNHDLTHVPPMSRIMTRLIVWTKKQPMNWSTIRLVTPIQELNHDPSHDLTHDLTHLLTHVSIHDSIHGSNSDRPMPWPVTMTRYFCHFDKLYFIHFFFLPANQTAQSNV